MTEKKKSPTLEAVELQLKQVELEKARVELRYLQAEEGTKLAEQKEAVASAAKAELDLKVRQLDVNRSLIGHGLTVDAAKGIFRLESPVFERVLELSAVIERYADEHPGADVTLHIFSPGGDVMVGLTLYDTLRNLSSKGHRVTTVVRGYCASMASVIFLAGDVRRIGAESLVHQHEPSFLTYGKASDVREDVDFLERLYEKITRIYVDRTTISRATFRKLTLKKEWYADAADALKYGIATEVS